MRLTIIHPCIGRAVGAKKYMRTWQMEPLPAAMVASLTPKDVEIRFFDDRMEAIDYDAPTDVVALSVETYTARRCYQIASEYRRRGVKVVMGGFHATLLPEEVSRYADVVVVGEAEALWPRVIDDLRHGTEQRIYRAQGRPSLARIRPDRSIFAGKNYLPVRLIEFGRGCVYKCDFCVIQTAFNQTQQRRPVEDVLEEVRQEVKPGDLIFFVDDNLVSHHGAAKEFLRELAKLKVRWVSQCTSTAAHDEELLGLMKASGCQCVLVGFESLDPEALAAMGKSFNAAKGGPAQALANFRKHGIRVYGTFLFGNDQDGPETFGRTLDFARDHAMFIAAFNHITPFPGTARYQQLQDEGRLLYDAWWLDERYRYGMIPFRPKRMTSDELELRCRQARCEFYGLSSIVQRGLARVNRDSWYSIKAFATANALHRGDISMRTHHPLGDQNWRGRLLEVGEGRPQGAPRLLLQTA